MLTRLAIRCRKEPQVSPFFLKCLSLNHLHHIGPFIIDTRLPIRQAIGRHVTAEVVLFHGAGNPRDA
jgi:hypothetical protein